MWTPSTGQPGCEFRNAGFFCAKSAQPCVEPTSVSLDRIEITPVVALVGEILQHRGTGYLTVLRPPARRILYWAHGDLVMFLSSEHGDSLPAFLVRHSVLSRDKAIELFGDDPTEAVAKFHEAGLLDLSSRQTLLRQWLLDQLAPIFSLDDGTAVFTDEEALPPEKRIFLSSTAALVVEAIRGITSGLVLRRFLGDMKRTIQQARDSHFAIESLPLSDAEIAVAHSLTAPESIESFLRHHAALSGIAAKVVVMMLALGIYAVVEVTQHSAVDAADTQRDLELLAAIGSADQRSLRVVAFSRQLAALDHYQVLQVPRAAPRSQITIGVEMARKRYDPASYPPPMSDTLGTILRRIDEASEVLLDSGRRAAYDRLLQGQSGEEAQTIQQRLTRRTIAEQNYLKARELATQGDFYGAIVLLRQAVNFAPDYMEAWHLLGSCQERNPKWRREAAESFQRALSINPENKEAMISLGDLYRSEGMITRAQTCYQDVLRIAPDNVQAQQRLQALAKK
jgi:tetratricopeptide (TPR) repeat protein